MKSILIIGGAGYIGTELARHLYGQGHHIGVLDTFWFGDSLGKDSEIIKINMDIRDLTRESDLGKYDVVIHLADVANDPSAELDPSLAWEIGCLGTRNVMEWVVNNNANRVIVASSGSVYGVSAESRVCEETELNPISTYNKVKMVKEKIVESYREQVSTVILRPATVAGVSTRQRLDLAVNLLTYQAMKYGIIKVLGGSQIRPHVHLHDMLRTYSFFVQNSKEGVFNVGFENLSMLELAERIKEITGARIEVENSNDPRSYRLCSHKLNDEGFLAEKRVEDAIREIVTDFETGTLLEGERTQNLVWMKKVLNLK